MPTKPVDGLRLITEAEFLNTTIALLKHGGYTGIFHIVDARIHAKVTATGFPDIFAIHPQRGILAAELKSEAGVVSEAQYDWLEQLRQHLPPPDNPYAASRAHLWRPRDADAIATQAGLASAPTTCNCPVCEANREERPITRNRQRASTAGRSRRRKPDAP